MVDNFSSDENNKFSGNIGAKPLDPNISNIDADNQSSSLESIIQRIEKNVLSGWDNPTYNIKFFAAPEDATLDNLPEKDIIVIAESGSTASFNIQELEINSVASPNSVTFNSLWTKLEMTILEPHGASLVDSIRNAAVALGANSHLDVPMWLEISFRGYESAEDFSYEGGGNIFRTQSLVYQISITRFNAEITSGGTRYRVEAIPFSDQALVDKYELLKEDVTIVAATAGEFFDKLAKKLSQKEKYDLEDVKTANFQEFIKYEFKVPDRGPGSTMMEISESRGWKIRSPIDDKSGVVKSGSYTKGEEYDKWHITFHIGTPLKTIVQEIIGSTIEGQSLALLGEETSSIQFDQLDTGRDPTKPAIIFIVNPTVEIDSYNAKAKKYNLNISYNVVPYYTYKPITSAKQLNLSTDNTDRLARMLKVCNIKKYYNYVNTGLNTEVLNYNLTIDRDWFLSLPIFHGQNKIQSSSGALSNTEEVKQIQIVESDILGNQSLSNAQRTAQPFAVDTGSITQLNEPAQVYYDESAELNTVNRQARLEYGGSSASSFGASSLRSQSSAENNIDFLLNLPDSRGLVRVSKISADASKQNRGTIYYAEDFDKISTNIESNPQNVSVNSKINAMRLDLSPTESELPRNIDGTASPSRSFYSAVMNQTYGMQGDMQRISMEIKGDPYWLGDPNAASKLEGIDASQLVQGTSDSALTVYDLTRADSLFIFTMTFPEEYDDGGESGRDLSYAGTGLAIPRPLENGFNAVYNVTNIKSVFANGRFTQTLDAVADILVREQDIINSIVSLSEQ